MDALDLLNRIHTCEDDELEALYDEIVNSGLSFDDPDEYSLLINHLWREFNKRADLSEHDNLMLTPFNGGLRPTVTEYPSGGEENIVQIGSSENITTIGGDELVQI